MPHPDYRPSGPTHDHIPTHIAATFGRIDPAPTSASAPAPAPQRPADPSTRDEALRALGAWTEENYAELMQAMERQAARCRDLSREETDPLLALTLVQSADAWSQLRLDLQDRYAAVPSEEAAVEGPEDAAAVVEQQRAVVAASREAATYRPSNLAHVAKWGPLVLRVRMVSSGVNGVRDVEVVTDHGAGVMGWVPVTDVIPHVADGSCRGCEIGQRVDELTRTLG